MMIEIMKIEELNLLKDMIRHYTPIDGVFDPFVETKREQWVNEIEKEFEKRGDFVAGFVGRFTGNTNKTMNLHNHPGYVVNDYDGDDLIVEVCFSEIHNDCPEFATYKGKMYKRAEIVPLYDNCVGDFCSMRRFKPT